MLCYATTTNGSTRWFYAMPVYMALYYTMLDGSIEYYSIMASLLAAKSMLYMGHLAANRDLYRARYTGIAL